MSATPTKVLVTGATGFIGARLCESFTLDHALPYRALVRNYSRAARIARLDAEMVTGDMLDVPSLEHALRGCDAVVHLAHADDKTAEEEVGNLVLAARRAGVRRFVHVSSMAVHGPSPATDVVVEDTPVKRWGEAYSDSKVAAENVVSKAMARGELPGVILRPTVVYGPYSGFVTPIIQDARAGRVSLVDGGRGVCNAVYVDDVCDAIVAALRNDSAVGGTFLVNGDDRLEWREFITTFAALVPVPTRTHDHSVDEITQHWKSREPRLRDSLSAVVRLATSPAFHAQLSSVPPVGTFIRTTKELVVGAISAEQKVAYKARLQGRSPAPRHDDEPPVKMPSKGRVVREAYRAIVSNKLAATRLGWRPRHSFSEGAARTASWLRFARMCEP